MPQPLEPQLLSRLLPAYVKARAEDSRKLHAALDTRDFQILERVAHKIKGSAGTYGFEKTADCAANLERAAQMRELEICAGFVENMEDLFFQA
jgi:HPt (histidine-containing phosphotransfer) domain-containing protein